MELYFLIVFFIFGTIFGSFFNVVAFRLPRGASIVNPPSHCPNCDYRLKPKDLVPIFSYLFLKGRCRNCQQKIAPFYALFELATGLLFALSYFVFGFSYELIIALVFSSMAIILINSDLHYYILPDEVLIVSGVLLTITLIIGEGFLVTSYALINGIIAFMIMLLIKLIGDFIFKKESMGGGDIKLMFIFGLLLGYEMAIIAIVLAAFIGLPTALILLLNKKIKEKIVPFGPFLCLAALIIFFSGYNFEQFLDLLLKISLF